MKISSGIFLNYRKSLLALSALAMVQCAAAEEPQPIIRNQESIEQGRENVRNVYSELKDLFNNKPRGLILQDPYKPVAPYCEIIDNGTNAKGEKLSTLIYRCRFTDAKQLYNALEALTSNLGVVEYVKDQNLIVVKDRTDLIEGIKKSILAMDIPSYQILIEAKIIEIIISDGMQRDMALSFGNENGTVGLTPNGGSIANQGATTNWTTSVGDSGSFNAKFQWLLKAQDAKVLSSPNIVVSCNETSKITTGQDIPIQEMQTINGATNIATTFRRVGVSLEVEPKMINRDHITLRVLPSVSNVQRYEDIKQGMGENSTTFAVPVIGIRSVETNLRLLDSQVVAMGGLYSSSESLKIDSIPFFSDIPWIGDFFTYKEKNTEVTQLIFFLKIHVLAPEDYAGGLLYDPEELAQTSNNIGSIIEKTEVVPKHDTTLDSLKSENYRKQINNEKASMVDRQIQEDMKRNRERLNNVRNGVETSETQE